ncbi:MAG: hypothetical protein K8Q89_11105, partial [Nitrosarchaeum sp.]|nr:hypothetical protein [Nitrosarchaeum sp.]
MTTIFTRGFSIDDAKLALKFDSLNNGTSGDAKITEDSLKLDGNLDFINVNDNSTNNLQSLTVSAWVKPDYSYGSREFTVVSKENSFSLTIDNYASSHAAKFSIFDGIRWIQVDSISEIPQEWTHLIASFSNKTISIYVNGTLEGTKQLEKIPSLSVAGKLESVDIEHISSNNDIVVGAYVSIKNDLPKPSYMFSGIVDDIALFDSTLSESQIKQLYSQGIPTHSPATAKSMDEILKEIEQETSLAQNNTDSIQAQLSLSDTLSYSYSQAQNIVPQMPSPSDALQAQLSLSDTLSYSYSQAQNTTSSLVVPNEIPVLIPVKETYSIVEDAEITLEYYNETEALAKEFENLDNAIELANTDTAVALDQSSSPIDFLGLFVLPIPEADGAKDDGSTIKVKIKELQDQVSQVKQREKLSKDDLHSIKDKIKLLTEQLKDESKTLTKQKKIDKLNSVISKLEKITNENKIQKNNWNDKETITAEIYDVHNNKVNLGVTFEKQREGKFDIKIDPTNAKPGIYKIKTILTVNGKQFSNESKFAWGLVSVNSMKSIYKPGETASFQIVVLNATGSPVCPANVMMQITDPNSLSTVLSSDDIVEYSCGLYIADYPITVSGNYTVNVQAETGNGIVNFATYFTALDHYDYDVIRNTDSKIDPFSRPNDFDVEIEITSFVGDNELTIHEYVPSSFEIFNTDATVETIGNQKILTWKRTPQDGFVNTIGYSYSVPLVTPELYALGKITIDQSGVPTFTEARNWFVAVDPHYLIDTAVTTIDARWNASGKRNVAINGTHIYSFYIDGASDLHFSYSKNGGTTWIDGGDIVPVSDTVIYEGLAVWYEPNTSGRTSQFIHIAAFDAGSDTMYYVRFDPTNLTFTTIVDIGNTSVSSDFGSLTAANDISITVSTDGHIYVGIVDASSPDASLSLIRQCDSTSSSCTSNGNWSNTVIGDPWGSDDGNDSVTLLPLPNAKIMLISDDVSANVIRSKIYDAGTNTFDGSWTTIKSGYAESGLYTAAISATIDKSTNNLYISTVNNPGIYGSSEVLAFKYSASSWTQLKNIFNATTGQYVIDTSIGIDDQTGRLYAIYNSGPSTTSTHVYSTASNYTSISWETPRQITNSTSDYRGLSINTSSDELLHAYFFDTTSNNLYGGVVTLSVSDSISAARTWHTTLSETVTASDVISTKRPVSKITLGETLSISDSIVISKKVSKTLSETITMSGNLDSAVSQPGDDLEARPKTRVLTGTTSGEDTSITISPALADYTKAIAMCTFSNALVDAHSRSYKAWAITDNTHLHIYGTTQHAASKASEDLPYVCNIVEFGSHAVVKSQTSILTTPASGALATYSTSISSVNLGQTMIWSQGHEHDAYDTGIGARELERVKLTDSTHWQWDVNTAPNTGPQESYVGILNWNNLDVNVQRGTTTIASGGTTKTLTAGSDFTGTAADRSRSLLFVSFVKEDTGSSYAPNTSYIRATINSSGNLVFTRNTSEATAITINWTLVQLPVDYANIRHGEYTQSSGTLDSTFNLSSGDSVDLARSFVIGTVCTPFGCGTGSSSFGTAGAIGTAHATLKLDNSNTVHVTRGSSSGTLIVGYQVIEFLPKKRVVTETLSVSDKLSTKAFFTKTLSETLSLSDTVAKNIGRTRSLSETLSVSDNISTKKFSTKTLTETLTPSDILTTRAFSTKTLTETLTPSDILTTRAFSTKTLTETLTPSDVLTTKAVRSITLSETLSASDVVSTTAAHSATLTETLTPSDILTTRAFSTKTLTETLTPSDVLTTKAVRSIKLSE